MARSFMRRLSSLFARARGAEQRSVCRHELPAESAMQFERGLERPPFPD